MFIDWRLSRNEKVCVGEYALKKEGILLADSTDNRSRLGQCWLLKNSRTRENSRSRSRTTVFTLPDYRAIQQTRPRIAQCKRSFRLWIVVKPGFIVLVGRHSDKLDWKSKINCIIQSYKLYNVSITNSWLIDLAMLVLTTGTHVLSSDNVIIIYTVNLKSIIIEVLTYWI